MALISDDKHAAYEIVLKDLKGERDEKLQQMSNLRSSVKELNSSIVMIERKLNPATSSSQTSFPLSPSKVNYANISVRWAILDLLHASEPKATSELAEALLAAGVKTKATNFANNVSAVLSTTMRDEHGEVNQLPDGRWTLTEKGNDAIEYIRTTPKFKRGCGMW